MRGDRFSSPLRERLPDGLRDVVSDVGPGPVAARSHLAGERAHDVVQPAVPLVVGHGQRCQRARGFHPRRAARIRAMRSAPPRRRLSEGRRESLAGGRCRSAAAGSSRRGGAPAGAPRSAPRRSGSSAPVSRPGPASSALHAPGVVNVARYKGSRRIVSAGREPGHGRGQSLPRPDRRERPARADGPAEHAPGVGVDRVQEPAVTA